MLAARNFREQREKRITVEEQILQYLYEGLQPKEIAQEIGVSASRIYQRIAHAERRLTKSSRLPPAVVSALLRPREKGCKPTGGQGPYSAGGATRQAVVGLWLFHVSRKDVEQTEKETYEGNPLLEIEAWVRARRNKDRFLCPHTLFIQQIAWELLLKDEQIWRGCINDLCASLDVPDSARSKFRQTRRKTLESISRDLEQWGDFLMQVTENMERGRLLFTIHFTRV